MSEVTNDTTVPVTTLAAMLGVTERRIQQLAKDGVVKKLGSGKYALIESTRGYIEFLNARSALSDGSEGKINSDYEQARLTKTNADIKEIELAKLRGDVGSIAEFERAWVTAFSVIRTNVLNVIQRVTPMLIGETDERIFKDKLRGELTEALKKAADDELDWDEDDDDGA